MLQFVAVGVVLIASTALITGTSDPLDTQPPPTVEVVAPEARTELIALNIGVEVEVEPPFFPAPDPFEGVVVPGVAAPAAVVPRPASPPPAWTSGPPALHSNDIIASAKSMLGISYVWGGNSLTGLDCSSYVSRAWGLSRQTTDTLYLYSKPITKDELLPGDAMNLTRSQYPRGYGHIRLFAA